MLGEGEEEQFSVWPENVRSLDLFLACSTQWRLGALGGVMGLDYQGLTAVMRMKRVREEAVMFDDIRAMEAAALPILNERRDE